MKRILILCLGLVMGFSATAAEEIWITQSTSGSDTGADAANAHSIAWFNTAGNWDTDNSADGKIGPGDTVYFSGTITNLATIQGSGNATDRITFKILPGSKFSNPAWTSSGGITAVQKGYFNVYGANTNAVVQTNWVQVDIENTANTNGSALYNGSSRAMFFSGCSNVSVSHLLITNIYRRVPGSATDLGGSASAISFQGSGDNVIVSNVAVFMASTAVNVASGNKAYVTNLWIKNCYAYATSTALQMGPAANTVLADFGFVGNRLDGFSVWAGIPPPDHHHNDGIQTITPGGSNPATTYMTNPTVAYNYIGPDTGTDSFNGFIFLEDYITGGKIHHNVLVMATGGVAANGFIPAGVHEDIITNVHGARMMIAYNTIKGSGGGTAISSQYSDIFGNVIYDTGGAIAISDASHHALPLPTGQTGVTSDTNIFYSTAQDSGAFGLVWPLGGSSYTPTRWLTCPFTLPGVGSGPYLCMDQGSLWNTDPLINSDGTLQAGSPAIAYGPNLTSLGITTDINGNARPSSGLWTLGAFEGTNSSSGGGGSGSSVSAIVAPGGPRPNRGGTF